MSATAPKQEVMHELVKAIAELRQAFDSGRSRPLKWRQQQLTGLLRFCYEQGKAILHALRADLGNPAGEAMAADLVSVGLEVASLKWNLRRLTRPTRVSTPLPLRPAQSLIQKGPPRCSVDHRSVELPLEPRQGSSRKVPPGDGLSRLSPRPQGAEIIYEFSPLGSGK